MFPLGLIGPRFGPLCSLELGVLIGHGDFIGSRWGHLLQFNSILKKTKSNLMYTWIPTKFEPNKLVWVKFIWVFCEWS